jgi:hypothetical protein
MFPKARHDCALLVAVLVESFFEEILCKYARLWETLHALLYVDIDGTSSLARFVRLYNLTKSGGRLLSFMRMNSGWSMGVLR